VSTPVTGPVAVGSPATAFSVALIGELIGRGVRDIVLCPGSRSQALALAAAAWERDGTLRLRVRIDERVAGFLALGIAVETGRPVAIITTSGTAVANLHPAVLEAHHSGIPLILLTADRPAELRGIGGNQTTDQVGIFGSAVAWVRDVAPPSDDSQAAALAGEAYAAATRTPGPVQLNLSFREPLSGPVKELPDIREHGFAEEPPQEPRRIPGAAHTVVIAGHGAGPAAEAFARSLGVPLLAEVSSGSPSPTGACSTTQSSAAASNVPSSSGIPPSAARFRRSSTARTFSSTSFAASPLMPTTRAIARPRSTRPSPTMDRRMRQRRDGTGWAAGFMPVGAYWPSIPPPLRPRMNARANSRGSSWRSSDSR
jgi:2-succinyl-5-enolpyruvyl-6-hydroxy-3-cyclohexene-1-carboxylate synthase